MNEQETWENLFRINREAKQGKLFNNLSLRTPSEEKVYSEVFEEYTSTLYEKSNILTIEDVRDDFYLIYSAMNLKSPQYIYINASPTATKEAIIKYKGQDKLKIEDHMGLFWQIGMMNYEILFRLGRIRADQVWPALRPYIKFLLKGVYDFKLIEDTAFITLCPRVFFDEEGKLHRTDGPAIEWHDHRDDSYYIHGKKYTKDEFDKRG